MQIVAHNLETKVPNDLLDIEHGLEQLLAILLGTNEILHKVFMVQLTNRDQVERAVHIEALDVGLCLLERVHELLRGLVEDAHKYVVVALVKHVDKILNDLNLARMLTVLEREYGLGLTVAGQDEYTVVAIVANVNRVVVLNVGRDAPVVVWLKTDRKTKRSLN